MSRQGAARDQRRLRIAQAIGIGASVASVLAVVGVGGSAHSATLDIIPDCQSARVARDASGVVGVTFRYPEGFRVVRWTPDRTIRRYPVDETFTRVDAVAQGGTVAVGGYVVGTEPLVGPYDQRSRWTEHSGVEILPHFIPTTHARYLPSSLSGDGRVAVGGQMGFPSVATLPVRWIDGVASSPYLPLPGQFPTGAIVETNWTGSIAWGWLSTGGLFGPFDYYRWTSESGGQWIPRPQGFGNTDLLGVVPEADVFIARGSYPIGQWRSFFLTPAGEITFTPQPLSGEFLPLYSTADRQALFGRIGVRATRWTANGGFQDVAEWITQDLGLDLDGWQLSWATGMSANGGVLTMDASKLFPDPVGWVFGCVIVQVPEPGVPIMLACGTLSIAIARSARARAGRRVPHCPGGSSRPSSRSPAAAWAPARSSERNRRRRARRSRSGRRRRRLGPHAPHQGRRASAMTGRPRRESFAGTHHLRDGELSHMTEFWEAAFHDKQVMWGLEPTQSAVIASEHFARAGAQRILIPGIGYGRNARPFIDRGMSVTGIEISATAIGIARSQLGLDLPIHRGSVTEMPFDDQRYDGIFCYGLIYLLDAGGRAKLIRDCQRQLAPGGHMFFTVISKRAPMYGQGKHLGDDWYERLPNLPMYFYDRASVQREFGNHGLREITEIDESSHGGASLPFLNVICANGPSAPDGEPR